MGKLNYQKIRGLTRPGLHGDGGTLFLNVAKAGTKSFIQRVTIRGRRVDLGLGPWPLISLREAREMAFDNRRIAWRGGDPRESNPMAIGPLGGGGPMGGTPTGWPRGGGHNPTPTAPTFREAAERVHRENLPHWRNDKACRQLAGDVGKSRLSRPGRKAGGSDSRRGRAASPYTDMVHKAGNRAPHSFADQDNVGLGGVAWVRQNQRGRGMP